MAKIERWQSNKEVDPEYPCPEWTRAERIFAQIRLMEKSLIVVSSLSLIWKTRPRVESGLIPGMKKPSVKLCMMKPHLNHPILNYD